MKKFITFAAFALLLTSCSNDDSPLPVDNIPIVEQPVDSIFRQDVLPNWLVKKCYVSVIGVENEETNTKKSVCFDETGGFLDLTFIDADGNWILPYQPISFRIGSTNEEFGKMTNFLVGKDDRGEFVSFDFVDIFYPKITLHIKITQIDDQQITVKLDDNTNHMEWLFINN